MKTSFKLRGEGKRIRDQTAYEQTPNWAMFDVELLGKSRLVKLRGEFPVPEFDDLLPGMTFSGLLTEKPLRDGTPAMEAKEICATNPRSVLVVQNMRRSSLHKLGKPLLKLYERFGEELYDALNRVAEGAAPIGTLGIAKRSAEMHVAVFKERKACIDLATEVPEIPTVALGAVVHATLEKLRADPYCIADTKVRSVRSMLAVSDTIARRADIALAPSVGLSVPLKEAEPAQAVDLRERARLAAHARERLQGPEDDLAPFPVARLGRDDFVQQRGEVRHERVERQRRWRRRQRRGGGAWASGHRQRALARGHARRKRRVGTRDAPFARC